ncbi:MAG: FCD domain-containing protein, partial [Alphaproteobacteria bacterium]
KEILCVRGDIEEAATRLAVVAMDGEVGDIQAQVDAMEAAAAKGKIDVLLQASLEFHRKIVAASANSLLLTIWDSLHLAIQTRVSLLEPGIDYAAIARSHQPIVDAIAARDVDLACRLAREHQAGFQH